MNEEKGKKYAKEQNNPQKSTWGVSEKARLKGTKMN